jgi:hypothetical protein
MWVWSGVVNEETARITEKARALSVRQDEE